MKTIVVTGNTVVDALQAVRRRLDRDLPLRQGLAERFTFLDSRKRLVLVTGHRRESFGDGTGDDNRVQISFRYDFASKDLFHAK